MDTTRGILTIGDRGTIQHKVPIVSYARGDYYIVSGTDAVHRPHHLNVHYRGNYRGEAEGKWFSRKLTMVSTTVHAPEGDYLYMAVSDYDYRRMLGAVTILSAIDETMIVTIPHKRQNYSPLNIHFCMRDAMTHYMYLLEDRYETDMNPHVLCLKLDYKALLREDVARDPQDRHYGTFNRHYMEYSMFALRDITMTLSPHVDYDHYMLDLPNFNIVDYTWSMPVPVYFDFSRVVTKHHILGNPHLVPAVLQSPACLKLVDDWNEHYRAYLGDLDDWVTNEIQDHLTKFATRMADEIERRLGEFRKSKL